MKTTAYPQIRLMAAAAGAALLPLLAGCVAGPGYGETRVQGDVVVDDDYVYYPDYEVYYGSRHHNYIYRDGGRWITRSSPPRVGVDVLVASPSVHIGFHDAPERHHTEVIKTYPKHWKPPGQGNEVRKDHRGNDRRDDRKERTPVQKNDRDDDDKKHN